MPEHIEIDIVGGPNSGKTTVARAIGDALKARGITPITHLEGQRPSRSFIAARKKETPRVVVIAEVPYRTDKIQVHVYKSIVTARSRKIALPCFDIVPLRPREDKQELRDRCEGIIEAIVSYADAFDWSPIDGEKSVLNFTGARNAARTYTGHTIHHEPHKLPSVFHRLALDGCTKPRQEYRIARVDHIGGPVSEGEVFQLADVIGPVVGRSRWRRCARIWIAALALAGLVAALLIYDGALDLDRMIGGR